MEKEKENMYITAISIVVDIILIILLIFYLIAFLSDIRTPKQPYIIYYPVDPSKYRMLQRNLK